MGQRIDDLISILVEIRQNFSVLDSAPDQIRRLRNEAEERIAQYRGVVKTTVKDAYTRKLGQGAAAQIDEGINSWLGGDSSKLRMTMLNLASDQQDDLKIAAFFAEESGVTDTLETSNSLRPAPSAEESVGAGFGDAESNARVERAAVQTVTDKYIADGWSVRSVESDRCGFDLLCQRGTEEENVEVKGVSGSRPQFIITAGEVEAARSNPKFVLFVVTETTSVQPRLHRYSGPEFWQQFSLAPLQYRAIPVAKVV